MTANNTNQGTVIAAFRRYTLIKDLKNNLIQCQQRKAVGQVICGDIVNWEKENDDTGVITAVEERNTVLERPDINGNLRPIAANIDQVFIVVTHKPELNEGLIDRYLVAAEHSHIKPVIVLNKIDLFSDELFSTLTQRLQLYKNIGYDVINTSIKQQDSMNLLKAKLQNNNNIFVGQSGVGKSSLINALLKDSDARVGEISESTGKGQHTTTTAYLYPLEQGNGHIIDSPGVREFGLVSLSAEEVANGFTEFKEYLGTCKFRNCAHNSEPGCALIAAVNDQKISEQRWNSYKRIIASL